MRVQIIFIYIVETEFEPRTHEISRQTTNEVPGQNRISNQHLNIGNSSWVSSHETTQMNEKCNES